MSATAASAATLADDLAVFVSHLMKRHQGDALRIGAELDLTVPQLRALFALEHAERDLALNELVPHVGLSVAATGRAADALHRAGLLTRRDDAEDRRVKRLQLTDAGRAVTTRLATARREALTTFTESLPDDDRERLAAALRPILARLDG